MENLIQTKNKTFKLTIHSIERQYDHLLQNVDLTDALSRAKKLQDSNSHKFGQALQRVYWNKKSYEPYTAIYVNSYYDIQFRVDSRTNTILTICPLSTQY